MFLTAGILTVWISVGYPYFSSQGVDHRFSLPLYFYVGWRYHIETELRIKRPFYKKCRCVYMFSCSMCILSTVYMNTSEAGGHICIYVCVLSGVVSECVRISREGRKQSEIEARSIVHLNLCSATETYGTHTHKKLCMDTHRSTRGVRTQPHASH